MENAVGHPRSWQFICGPQRLFHVFQSNSESSLTARYQAHKDHVPRGSRFCRNGRVRFSFLVYSISKNALDDSPSSRRNVRTKLIKRNKRCGGVYA